MLTKTLAWGVIALSVACVTWWWWDPAGFAHNPVLTWLKQLSPGIPEPGR